MMASQTITVDTRGLEARFRRLKNTEIPSAMRNTINDLMQDTVKRERKEIERVFDRPTPYIAKSPAVKTKATKTRFMGELWLRGENNVLKPHIPGYKPRRDLKAIENLLRGLGQLSSTQYLVPSRTMRLDRFGNVSPRTVRTMLGDLGGRGPGRQFIWGTVNGKRGPVGGVWYAAKWRGRRPGALALLAVNAEPLYPKVFDFFGVGVRHARQRLPYFARRTIDALIARRNG